MRGRFCLGAVFISAPTQSVWVPRKVVAKSLYCFLKREYCLLEREVR